MKSAILTLMMVTVGAVIALLAYDHWVAYPRAVQLARDLDALQEQTREIAENAKLDMPRIRSEAQVITDRIDASIAATVASAQTAFDDIATLDEQRHLARDALIRASVFKTSIAESYMNSGTMPTSPAEAGLDEPAAYAGGAVSSIAIGEGGRIAIDLIDRLAGGGILELIPEAGPIGVSWHCKVEGSAQLKRLFSSCLP